MRASDLLRLARARLRALVRPSAIADEIREELDFHVEARTREHEDSGLSPGDARRAALARFGNPLVIHDRGYDLRGGGLMESVAQDVRYGVRLLFKHRGFSLVAVLTLALGIGATTAISGVIDAVMIRPLPYPHAEQLVGVSVADRTQPGRLWAASVVDLDAWRALRTPFSFLATISGDTVIVADGSDVERLSVALVTSEYLPLFGVRPVFGRFFTEQDERLGADPAVLLGQAYWQRRYHRDPQVVGQTIRFTTGTATIIGIVPETFFATEPIWRPLQLTDEARRQHQFNVTGRLREGVTLAQAQREIDDRAATFAAQVPADKPYVVRLTSLYERTTKNYRATIEVLAGAVGFVLLIACVNVASLQLARGATRESELAIRASIGAGRGRLVRQLLIESVLLALAGGAVGALLAWLIFDILVANIPIYLPANVTPAIDGRVLVFTALVAAAAGVAFGLAPALKLSRVAPARLLNTTLRGTRSSSSPRARKLLVVIEVASAAVLVAGGGLTLRSFQRLSAVDLGFAPESIVTLEAAPVDATQGSYDTYYPALLARLRALPGVSAVGATNELPLGGASTFSSVRTDGPGGDERQPIEPREILPGYFEAIGLRVLAGRVPDERDRTSGARVVTLSETAARQLFPDRSPLGHRLLSGDVWYDVIGVVGDVRHKGPDQPVAAQVYFPYGSSQAVALNGTVRGQPLIAVVRPRGNASALPAMLRDAARSVGPRVIVRRVRSGRDWWDYSVTDPRQRTVLLSLLGGLGLVLALVGVFGVTSFAVAQRTREIGVHLALGARPGQVVGAIVKDASMPIAVGLAVGIAMAFFATRLIASFLFQTTPRDPLTFALVVATLGVTGCLASYVPARRAARVDPVVALRQDN
jgi:putative ABC transport system permease protein